MFSYYSPITDVANLKKTLDTYGVAVIPNVFTGEECEHVKKGVFDYLAKQHDVHEPDDYDKIHPIEGGILHYYGIALLKEVLEMKTDQRVVDIFKTLWDNEEVTMSLDGMNIGPPPEQMKQRDPGSPAGFHTDQGNRKQGLWCIQALINLENTDEGDGCLSVLTTSNQYHDEFFEQFHIDTFGSDWFVLKKNHYDWFIQKGCEWKKILASKGSIVFWDSRTIHRGTAHMPDRKHPEHWRFVIYVCYTPAKFQTKEDTMTKKKAYSENRCTTHWPYDVVMLHKMPNDKKKNDIDSLTPQMKKCLGFD